MISKEDRKIIDELEYIEPETVKFFLGEDVPSIEILKEMVIKLIKNTDAPFQDFYVFENVVHVLNGKDPDIEKIEGSLPEEIWLALIKMKDLVGEDFGLSDEIKSYIRWAYKDNGLLFLPPIAFTDEENPNFKEILDRTKKEKLIESEDLIENQAIELAKILHYIEENKE